MSQKTQGTELYAIDPVGPALIEVGCFTSLDVDPGAEEQLEDTCMPSLVRTYLAGLPNNGTATFELNWDPSDASHTRLYALKGTNIKWAVGESDGTGVDPTVDSNGDFVLPSTRSWLDFEGFISNFPWNRALSSVTKSPISVTISGAVTQTSKT